jgi:hypothetical protein
MGEEVQPYPIKTITDPAAAKEAQDEEKRKRERELSDMKWLLSDARGRRVIAILLDHCGVYRGVFTGNSTTFYNAGKQDVGHFLAAYVTQADQMALVQIQREQISEMKLREAKTKRKSEK